MNYIMYIEGVVKTVTRLFISRWLIIAARGSTLVCRRQILMTKVDPRKLRVKIFIMVVDP